jgi:hypothetical protein
VPALHAAAESASATVGEDWAVGFTSPPEASKPLGDGAPRTGLLEARWVVRESHRLLLRFRCGGHAHVWCG